MTTVSFTFQRGASIALAVDALTGDPSGLAATAHLRPAEGSRGEWRVKRGSVKAADFVVVERAAAGDIPAGWNLTIDPAASSAIDPGIYIADLALVAGGAVAKTQSVGLRITEPATILP